MLMLSLQWQCYAAASVRGQNDCGGVRQCAGRALAWEASIAQNTLEGALHTTLYSSIYLSLLQPPPLPPSFLTFALFPWNSTLTALTFSSMPSTMCSAVH